MNNLSKLSKLGYKIFYAGLFLQTLVLGITTFIVILISYYDSLEGQNSIVKSEYKQIESALIQSLFVIETIAPKKIANASEIPQIATLIDRLKIRNVNANVYFDRCGIGGSDKNDHLRFDFNIGTRRLYSCLFIDVVKPSYLNVLRFLFITVGISFLSMLIIWNLLKNQITKKFIIPIIKDLEIKNSQLMAGEMARQVAHDIRSPLTALQIAVSSIDKSPVEAKVLIEKSTARICKIAEDLLSRSRNNYSSGSSASEGSIASGNHKISEGNINPVVQANPVIINHLCQDIINEKRATCLANGHNIDSNLQLICTENVLAAQSIVDSDLRRILSNLIGNSIEALNTKNSKVLISTSKSGNRCLIEITDNGKGIPDEILSKIGTEGFSYGKENGNGLGLHHAIRTIKSWGGDVKIRSKVGVGTTVTLTLPAA